MSEMIRKFRGGKRQSHALRCTCIEAKATILRATAAELMPRWGSPGENDQLKSQTTRPALVGFERRCFDAAPKTVVSGPTLVPAPASRTRPTFCPHAHGFRVAALDKSSDGFRVVQRLPTWAPRPLKAVYQLKSYTASAVSNHPRGLLAWVGLGPLGLALGMNWIDPWLT